MRRFTVTEFEWPHLWFAVRDNEKQYHVSSHGSRSEAEWKADELNRREAETPLRLV